MGRSNRPNWFFCKFRLELDLAQKLTADAISAAVAQMKSETSSNEESPREEENSPVLGIFYYSPWPVYLFVSLYQLFYFVRRVFFFNFFLVDFIFYEP